MWSNFNIRKAKLETILLVNILVKLSYFVPKLIIINSKKAKKFYEAKGYDKKKLLQSSITFKDKVSTKSGSSQWSVSKNVYLFLIIKKCGETERLY